MHNTPLALGSVVELALQGAPRFVVCGYFPRLGEVTHDYLGVPWPTGLAEGIDAMAFNESSIEGVVYAASAPAEEAQLTQRYADLMRERAGIVAAAREELARAAEAEAPAEVVVPE